MNNIQAQYLVKEENLDIMKEGFVYMVKIYFNNEYTGIVKIGSSKAVGARIASLNKRWKKHNVSFKKYLVGRKIQYYDALNIEKSIHCILENKKESSSITCDGSREFFKHENWMDNMLQY